MSYPPMNVLVVAAEVAPFAKVGGLADVAGALPRALRRLGHDVRVAMPAYRMVETDPRWQTQDLVSRFPVHLTASDVRPAYALQTQLDPDVPVYLVGGHPHFQQATRSEAVYALEAEPYAFLSKAVAELLTHLRPAWIPDVVHCNDWHTGLLCVYLDTHYGGTPTWARCGRVFTIHNLAYQGTFGREVMDRIGVPPYLFNMHDLEFYGQANFMKGGVVHAHRVNTVSPTYAREIQTPEFGCGLDGLMRKLTAEGKLSGIINGIDQDTFDPANDPAIAAAFSAQDPGGKAICKAALQAECGLAADPKRMVVGLVSRLADQKGLDLIERSAARLLALPIQLVVLGTGDAKYERLFARLQSERPRQVYARLAFDADLAQRIYAGCDAFLMPSRFEPCGLGQLISLRYGTIPVVRLTGGLADTVTDADEHPEKGNGFAFGEYADERLVDAVRRAARAFADPSRWQRLVTRALAADHSWDRSATVYEALYADAHAASDALSAASQGGGP